MLIDYLILLLLTILNFIFIRKYINKDISELRNILMRMVIFNLIILININLIIEQVIRIRYSYFLYLFLLLVCSVAFLLWKDRKDSYLAIKQSIKKFSFNLFIFDFLLLFSILKIRFFDRVDIPDYYRLSEVYLIIFPGWLFGGFIYHHFSSSVDSNYWKYIWKYIKNYIFLILLSLFIILSIFNYWPHKLKLIEAILLYSFSSWLFFNINFFRKIPAKDDIGRIKFLRANDFTEKIRNESLLFKGIIYSINGKLLDESFPSVDAKLKDIYLRGEDELYQKISKRINLKTISVYNTLVIKSRDIYNIEILPDNKMQLIINLHRLNDIKRINAYFIEVNKKLINGGIFICCFQSNELRYEHYLKNFPYFLAIIFYFFDFLIHRVLPKLPIIQKVYFYITNGHNRALALSEGLGRLSYSGFNFIDVFQYKNLVYCLTYKAREPSNDLNPSYGLVFKMRRIGKDGKEFYVYKFRTMHPYSEYIQGLIYDLFKLEKGGKIKNDFRITIWGKLLRKMWIDELPMLINFIRGDLKLFGVRPLSKHYFNLYPEELKQLRIKVKPGLVPPFYYDLPKTFEEIIESERNYLVAYFNNPLKTDVRYFLRAIYNIVFKHARSA